MIRHIIGGAKRAFGLHHPGRNLDVFPDDVFLVSFPKSGNTWTRFLVANLLFPERRPNFGNLNQLIPDPEALSKRDLARIPRPRMIKSHQYFDPRYPRVIYIVRDPRDVLLSRYHFHRKRRLISDNAPLEPFVQDFLIDPTSPYGSWHDNVLSWLATRQRSETFLLLRYEDMLADTVHELARIASFLGIPADIPRMNAAVEASSADSMRKLEEEQGDQWSTTKDTRKDLPFVRAAKSGNWKSELPESCVSMIESAWGPLLNYLGYELRSAPAAKGIHSAESVIGSLVK